MNEQLLKIDEAVKGLVYARPQIEKAQHSLQDCQPFIAGEISACYEMTSAIIEQLSEIRRKVARLQG
jgi:hypothetical protein